MAQYYDFDAMRRYIMEGAAARGMDPFKAVEVFSHEGLKPGVWQSNVKQPYGRERSYGPAQLHVAPEGRKPGLGNVFKEKFNLDPADPKNAFKTVDYALDIAAQDGWKQWYGAKDNGIGRWEGISKNAKPLGLMQASYSPEQRAPLGSQQGLPGVSSAPPAGFRPPQGLAGIGPPQGLAGAVAGGVPATPPFDPSSPQIAQPANAGPPKPTGPGGGAYNRIMTTSQERMGGTPPGPRANPADMQKIKASLMSLFQPKPPPLPVGGAGGGIGGSGGGGGGLLAMLSGLFG